MTPHSAAHDGRDGDHGTAAPGWGEECAECAVKHAREGSLFCSDACKRSYYAGLYDDDDLDDDLDPCNYCDHDNTRHRGDGCLDSGCVAAQ